MDLGGGSAEVSRVAAGKFQRGQTTPLGSVRLTEMFFAGAERVSRGDIGRLVHYTRPFFDSLGWMNSGPFPRRASFCRRGRHRARAGAH